SHTCGVAAGGTYCWGLNDHGQLGDGTSSNQDSVAELVRGGLTFTQVTAGGDQALGGSHSCGITAAGAAYCWGSNKLGQLGDGTITDRATPVAVTAQSGVTFTQISAGDRHTCARASDGNIYCWGNAGDGALG